jgi:histidinol-phosphate aminotransferase
MISFHDLVRENVRTLNGYSAGKSSRQAEQECGVTCIKLASNENPFGPSPLAVEAMRTALAETNLYPDDAASELRAALAAHHSVPAENVLVTAGSTSLIGLLSRTLLEPGLNAISSELSFIAYPIMVKAAGGSYRQVAMRNHSFDLEAIAAAIDSNTRLVFIANPNNPTGTMLTAQEVERFLARVPETVTVVLDEAYYDFAEWKASQRGVQYSRSLDYVRQGRNVVVLRTFSKAHGLAGVRIGYGVGPAELMGYCSRLRTTFSVSVVAQAAGMAALQDTEHVRRAVINNSGQAEWLVAELLAMGYQAVPTWANFLYVELGEDAAGIADRLQGEGVIIRPLGPWGAPQAIRVTIGTPEQNQRFVKAFKTAVDREVAHEL